MKTIIFTVHAIIFLLSLTSFSYAQENNSKIDSLENRSKDSVVNIKKDSVAARVIDQFILNVLTEVNTRSASIDGIHSEADIYVNTKTIDDESGNIEVRAKKPDEFWFRIWGSMIGISKDAYFGHFTRESFLYFNNLLDYTIEGPTTEKNIGYITKMKTSFYDMLNVLTGTVYIPYTPADSISMYDDRINYNLTIINKDYHRKYYIKKSDYAVSKFEYYNSRNYVEMYIIFSDFVRTGNVSYANKIEVRRPLTGETFRITFTSYQMNVNNLDFRINVPNDSEIKRTKWKN